MLALELVLDPSKTFLYNGQYMSKRPVFSTSLGKLYNGDCLDILPIFESESFDCIFADPPFNIGKYYGKSVNDSRAEAEYLLWTEKWLSECVRLLKEGGSLFVYNIPKWNIYTAHYLSQHLNFRHWVTVDYKAALPIPGKLYTSHYSLLYFTKGKPSKFIRPKIPVATCRNCGENIKDYGGYAKFIQNNGGINLSDVWTDISPIRHKKYKHWEYNELPEKIIERVLEISTSPLDLVLDPFGGSGTTYAVAEKHHRRWIGCEIEDASIIMRRLKKVIENKDENNKLNSHPGSYESESRHITSLWGSHRASGAIR